MIETGEQLAKGIAGAFHVLELWNLNVGEMRGVLGFPFGTQLVEWRAGNLASMPADVVKRLRQVGTIYGLLRDHPAGAAVWLRQPNAFFGNLSPLERMASGDAGDLIAVRDYLKTHRRTVAAAAAAGGTRP